MASTPSGPAYRIHTDRLVIRCWQPQDAPLLQTAISQSVDHLRPWMPWIASEPEELQTKIERLRRFRGMFDLGQDFIYGIFNADETQVLGGTGLHTRIGADAREIGYWMHKDYLNQGLATEASAALTRVAFEIDRVQRVEIHCDPSNVRSAAVPRKLGFTHDGTLRRRVPFLEEVPRDSMIWSMFADEYPASPAATADITAYDVVGRRLS
ncbi:MAG TPA: GNAT family protein [Roseiflexaceae bacterium]|nr:GNAT family protein [Roseiflexaceae bacterium]